ncbi:collagen alpha-2(IV) chain-like protein, partial [Aphelenchoides avenae]
ALRIHHLAHLKLQACQTQMIRQAGLTQLACQTGPKLQDGGPCRPLVRHCMAFPVSQASPARRVSRANPAFRDCLGSMVPEAYPEEEALLATQ